MVDAHEPLYDELRRLGFDSRAIDEAIRARKAGLFASEPPDDLVERIQEACAHAVMSHMRDDIDTASAEAFLGAFSARAVEEFERRMDGLAHYLREIEGHPEAHATFRALVAMAPDLRRITMGDWPGDQGGARTLSGIESVVGFVHNYVVLERDCHAAPHVPQKPYRDTYLRSALAVSRGGDVRAQGKLALWLDGQARFTEIRDGVAPDGKVVRAAEILACIERNERVEAEIAERRADLDRRRRAALARIEGSAGRLETHMGVNLPH